MHLSALEIVMFEDGCYLISELHSDLEYMVIMYTIHKDESSYRLSNNVSLMPIALVSDLICK